MNLDQLIQAILTAVKNDAIKTAMPIILAFFQNVTSNPSQLNITAQVASLEVQLLAALPNLEAASAIDVAKIVQQEVQALATQLQTNPAAIKAAAVK